MVLNLIRISISISKTQIGKIEVLKVYLLPKDHGLQSNAVENMDLDWFHFFSQFLSFNSSTRPFFFFLIW